MAVSGTWPDYTTNEAGFLAWYAEATSGKNQPMRMAAEIAYSGYQDWKANQGKDSLKQYPVTPPDVVNQVQPVPDQQQIASPLQSVVNAENRNTYIIIAGVVLLLIVLLMKRKK